MQLYNFSESYIKSVENGKKFHSEHKTWSGKGTLQYTDYLKNLIKRHNIKTILDFGSGKGIQYTKFQLDKLLAVEVMCYDPCIHGLEKWPNGQFDMVIALDCITLAGKNNLPWLYSEFSKWAQKCVYIASQVESPGKLEKQNYLEDENKVVYPEDLIIESIDMSKFYIMNNHKFIYPR